MKAVLITLLVVVILIVGGGAAFVYSGIYDVAAIHPDNPLVGRIIHTTSDRAVATRLGEIAVPTGYDAADKVAAGAKTYGQTCVVCHGGPGLQETDIAAGLNPSPPNLARAGRQPDAKENYWFVSNGVKMTGMPGFSKSLTEDQIWSVVAFLNTLPGMSNPDFVARTGVSAPQTAVPAKLQ